ncbi:MAG: tRNA 5-methoxyuridine(34)/uridine 5-oxyacetic acid(34) synthase CmoB [Gammaproteobacteria bacterium]|nr:tRNA 5-methoxyuridine(34)/uridine 5-oxyacetic acid(34) synthase CmoB [Gammaproteobacteria bacterium]MBT8111256.1 tRNA 5-methoxyuridine(34)/uridine 5-oxyacetic acid(34) synthase CmoB [Gammaproteobacteria bacterium]NND48610.1 tRNA 5-methoxyuridine(34)/uridine 5-oxyacetic acid(34) synthase CmoB [Woeseiaceae bacterium]NNL45954.1 tRNA 5-methoxyuridine(34)/uridine 5-oxyacetic acid(34) synthase CmoB [Woeseiaceae bacterium]
MVDLLDTDALADGLTKIGLADWPGVLQPLLETRMSARGHGDYERWREILLALPAASSEPARLRELLLGLSPWRKGPFNVNGIEIDAEWRSDRKWARLAGAVLPLKDRNILDVGCGNGYYALQMRKAGAHVVIGIDPTLLYVMQFLAVNTFEHDPFTFVLPLRLEETPGARNRFDTTFSMGVLYHQRSPIDHLQRLKTTLRPGGQLVLETIFVPGEESYACTPEDRYARMRNVWLLPTIAELTTWMRRTGFRDIEIIDQSVTTTDEQRSTEWMPFESLREALDPDDPSKTLEGWPAPRRVVVTAISP